MTKKFGFQHCERAREWTSLALDDALSEIEGALLEAHLQACVDCRAFADDLSGVSALLRSAPLAAAPLAVLPRRRVGNSKRIVALASASVLLATAAAGLAWPSAHHSSAPTVMLGDGDQSNVLRSIRRPSLIASSSPYLRKLDFQSNDT